MLIRSLNFIENSLRQPKVALALAIGVLVCYLAPLLIVGDGLYYMHFDNLDSVVVWMKILANSGMIFSDSNAIVPNMMGGLPRHTYGSEFNVLLWLFYFFPPFTAYVINEILMHVVAFIAMWVFLSNHLIKPTRGNQIFILFGALYFSILPYWPGGGLSIPAMPLAMNALLNIRAGKKSWVDWLTLALIPLYSSLVVVYFFFLLSAGVFWLIDSLFKRQWQWQFLGAIAFMGIVYLGVEYRLVQTMFFNTQFHSHREEFGIIFINPAIECYKNSLSFFLNGDKLSKGNHYLLLLPVIVMALILEWRLKRFDKKETIVILLLAVMIVAFGVFDLMATSRYFLPILTGFLIISIIRKRTSENLIEKVLLIIIVIAVWSNFWFYEGWQPVAEKLSWMSTFNMSRFVFLVPVGWGILGALAFKGVAQKIRYGAIILAILTCGIVYIAVNNTTYLYQKQSKDTYRGYYAENVFLQVKDYIGKPQSSYRIASLGIPPAVALYNGFYTIDGYSVNYPLEYKHRFQKIFEKEIPKNSFINTVFTGWGSKCYIYTRACFYDKKNFSSNFSDMDLNISALYEIGARYVIAPVKIPSPPENLIFEKSFRDKESLWEVYLYKVVENPI